MIKTSKYIFRCFLLGILTIPMFLGLYLEYFIIVELEWLVIKIAISGLLILIFLCKIIEVFGYNQKTVEVMKEHDVIFSLINKNNKLILWIFFPIIIITEELIFRYYSIGFLVSSLKLDSIKAILISSLIFSLYHIHTWFRYKNLKIFLFYLGFPFLLGLYTGFIFLKLGLISCILVHYIVAFFSYYSIYRRYFRTND